MFKGVIMGGIPDGYNGRLAQAFEELDTVLSNRADTFEVNSQMRKAFAVIRGVVKIDERGAVVDEVLDRLSRSDLSDHDLTETVTIMAHELPFSEKALA